MDDLVSFRDIQVNGVGHHVDDSWFPWRSVFSRLVALLDCRIDFFFAFAPAAHFFNEESRSQRRSAALGVKAGRLLVQRRLAIHKARKSVRAFTDFFIAASLQHIDSRAARNRRWRCALREFDSLLSR